ncbi:site-specific integrase [uncultured Shimia sp.]|uniref:tyrosine-type recombinase/integrase n=1 Tax=uncultured Shimia sp. TaxID=573152 RepID=UPI00262B828D|nr:site-specific integrase [uncultured Shimia sp.]
MAVDKLSATRVKKLGPGKHSDGKGLYFWVRGATKTWSLRYTDADGRRREKSLGVYPEVDLDKARALRDADIGEARGKKSHTVRVWFGRWLKANRHDLKDSGRAGRWLSPVKVHVLPALGHRDLRDLTFDEILAVFDPIWRTKTSASKKALDRLGMVLRYAETELPVIDVRLVPRVRERLGNQRHTVTNIPAMPWAEVPTLYATLGETPTELALRLLILTASRSAPVRFGREEQFEDGVWSIPAENMKNSKPFRIPLSDESQRVIDLARPLARDGFLFCAYRGKPISDAAMAKYLAREGYEARPHGFRSSFRDWCEETDEPWHLSETSLAHSIGSKTERSYARSDLLDQRRPLMQRWADHVTNAESVLLLEAGEPAPK